jgi:16S rRNA (guanine(966)-N(2))-methyltransferase RsmD
MRIISGIYGRRRFQIPPSFSARPTTDFAKENLFNVIENLIDWDDLTALDLFAGTGSISFELLSRGCRSVTAVELNQAHASFIRKVAGELKTDALQLIRGDVFRYLRSPGQAFDFIFADPPYALKELPELPRLVLDGKLLRKDGIFVLEHSKEHDFSAWPQFHQKRVYGSVNFSIFREKQGDVGKSLNFGIFESLNY